MAVTDRTSSLGPAIFIGLTVYALATYTPPDTVYLNPADTMDLADVTRPVSRVRADAPFWDHPPHRPPPRIVAVAGRPDMGPPSPSDRLLADRARAAPDPAQLARIEILALRLAAGADLPRPVPAPALVTAYRPADRRAAPVVPDGPGPPGATPAPDWMLVTGTAVNLRAAPDIGAETIGQFDSGVRGHRLQVDGEWSLVNFLETDPPLTGWMFSAYLLPENPP